MLEAQCSANFLEACRIPSAAQVKLLVTLHGAREDAVDSICGFGAKDLRRTDPGYAGAGIYTTIQAESAMAFGNSGEL